MRIPTQPVHTLKRTPPKPCTQDVKSASRTIQVGRGRGTTCASAVLQGPNAEEGDSIPTSGPTPIRPPKSAPVKAHEKETQGGTSE